MDPTLSCLQVVSHFSTGSGQERKNEPQLGVEHMVAFLPDFNHTFLNAFLPFTDQHLYAYLLNNT